MTSPRRPRPRLPRSLPAALVALASLAAATVLAGCASTVSLEAAPLADDPACAAVTVRLPDLIGTEQLRETDAQGTAAWGTPASALLRCGFEPVEVSDDLCYDVEGVYWLVDDSAAPRFRFTTYGRTPAVEVIVDNEVLGGRTALEAVGRAVQELPETGRQCVSLEDAELVG